MFPSVCVVCGFPVEKDMMCENCYRRVVSPFVISNVKFVEDVWVLGKYDGELKELVLKFKFGGRIDIGKALALALMKEFSDKIRRFSLIVPIPMERMKLAKRGFNQSRVLAKELSRLSGVRFLEPVFKRKRVREQVGLKAEERWENVKDAFGMKKDLWLKGENVLIVDDVITTGATLSFAAKTLIQEGEAECVSGLTIAG